MPKIINQPPWGALLTPRGDGWRDTRLPGGETQDPGTIALVTTNITVTEGNTATITASRNDSFEGASAVDWAVSDGLTFPASGSLSWADGEGGNKSATPTASLVDGQEVGTVTLSNPRRTDGGQPAPTLGTASGSITVQPTPQQGDLNPHLVVEYIDQSGTRQAVNVVDGVTTITGVAPFLVHFDASGTRAPAAFAAETRALYDPAVSNNNDSTSTVQDLPEVAYSFLEIGYRINYGEGVGGAWEYPAGQAALRDEDTGQPIFGRVYRTVGTHTCRLKCRDALNNEVEISFTVEVLEPPTAVHIPVSQGSWPNWQSGTRYTLDRGGNYSAFGQLTFPGRHGIIIEAVGSGNRPVVGALHPDNRYWVDSPVTDRARNIRLVGLDISAFSPRPVAFEYVGLIDCVVRQISNIQRDEYLSPDANTPQRRENLKHVRGVFFWESELRTNTSNGYVMFGVWGQHFHLVGSVLRDDSNIGTSVANLRLYNHKYSVRHCLFSLEVSHSFKQLPLSQLAPTGANIRAWADDDLVGAPNGSGRYCYPSGMSAVQKNQVYSASFSHLYNGIGATGGNPSEGNGPMPYLAGWEDSVWHPTSPIANTVNTFTAVGKYIFWRNVRAGMGSGAVIGMTQKTQLDGNNDPHPDWMGPYLNEASANLRPVPTQFSGG